MDKIHINQPYLNFLISLADFSGAERILLLTGVIDTSSLPTSVRDKTSVISTNKEDPIVATQDLNDFDLTIIVPNFGRVSKQDLRFPESWEASGSATGFIEDAWLAWGINSTREKGQIIAVTSQGMLNSTLRQPTRQQAIKEGLESVIILGATYKPETRFC